MTPEGRTILDNLETVARERRRREGDGSLDERVRQVKQYQHTRFAHTYRDILAQPRYARAARFFLDDLYGPHDFTERDAQFARIVPALVRLFPQEIVATVAQLAELHALSEEMDTLMGAALGQDAPDATSYVTAWQAVGRPQTRERQVQLMLGVGHALDRLTRNPLLRHSLRLMRAPARAAGLSALQTFLETGFDTFREMRGAAEFLATIAQRERSLSAELFRMDPATVAAGGAAASGQLP